MTMESVAADLERCVLVVERYRQVDNYGDMATRSIIVPGPLLVLIDLKRYCDVNFNISLLKYGTVAWGSLLAPGSLPVFHG